MTRVDMSGTLSSTLHINKKSNSRNGGGVGGDVERGQTEVDNSSHSSRETKKPHYLEVENLNDIPLWLTSCNSIAALFQMTQAVFLFGFSNRVNLHWLLYTNYPYPEREVVDETPLYAVPDPTEVARYRLTYWNGAFILVSALSHASCAMPYFRERYEYMFERHQCPRRWLEYSISCPMMKVLIAQLVGVTDFHILLMIFFMTNTVPCFAILHERLNAKARADGYEQTWMAFNFALIPYAASMYVIISYLVASWSPDQPAVYGAAICITLLLDLCFPIAFVLQWKKIGIFERYIVGELTFIILSFTAKTVLAWASLGGVLVVSKSLE